MKNQSNDKNKGTGHGQQPGPGSKQKPMQGDQQGKKGRDGSCC